MPAQRTPRKHPNERQHAILASFENPRRTMPLLSQGRILFGGSLSQYGWAWNILPLMSIALVLSRTQNNTPMGVILFLGVFILIGSGIVFVDIRNNVKALALLQYGSLAVGRLKEVTRTGAEVNGRKVYAYRFEFIATDGIAYEVVTRTHRGELVADEGQELILYDPQNPQHAILFDTIPGQPLLDPQGNIEVDSPLLGLACMLLPSINLAILLGIFFSLAKQ